MKYSELERKIKAAGCYIDRPGKKHDIWYSPTTEKHFPFPRHKAKEVPDGTLTSIMRDAGLK